ncbi:polymer-forming cytoskeletal protein [Deinococcus taklimakanensis]|uniref:Polymer-forming cytoskeletal protein n=1 Tax=Deinococcus taklimakanensis TaxID=536443 RepID=A0ABW5P041_9DEIO
MGHAQHNPDPEPAARAEWLDWLHQEAEGDLSPAGQARLVAVPDQAAVAREREGLARVTASLRLLEPPELPESVAAPVASDIALSARLMAEAPALPRTVAAEVLADIRLTRELADAPPLPRSVAASVVADLRLREALTPPPMPRSVAAHVAARLATEGDGPPAEVLLLPVPAPRPHNPAPLVLVSGLMVGLTLLALTTAWPNLAAGALVLQTLLAQVSPLAGVGLLLLLLTSLLVTWQPTPAVRRAGAGAFALAAALTLPALGQLADNGTVTFGRNVTVNAPVTGNVIAVGGNVHLESGADVRGEVVTLLGDVHRDPNAAVSGRVNALLGHAPGDRTALETHFPAGLGIASAAAFKPVLGWLGAAAWPKLFLTLTGGALLLLFTLGAAPVLARRQRHAPMPTLALGVLALAALLLPALALALAGLLGPALVAGLLAVVLLALGLSVSAYDVGRALAQRVRLPVPDAVGALLGLSVVAASLGEPPLALALTLVGGTWGAGTLLLARRAQKA